ncbi:Xaa-Pro peptidase family protein [Hoeflea sp. YIM 152468]|uniref:M24 family metallopeptidase n=1 Tax=Hoeflea sp. YIM 152468 TaxID=3031759 RepID=UPI0023DC477D|nr:Xaa-Pro peptidase family protein [Hoeflea sp. YIM 152468]MDF1609955.1 Xaa-Pro peptidase family protein [Hoeflea sp. YIM 152468]
MLHDYPPLHAASAKDLPYRFEDLDASMEAAGLDAIVATSKHNVRYLLGGYQFIFFSAMDAIGQSRYLPAFVYIRGESGKTCYLANKMEGHEHSVMPFWVPQFRPDHWGSVDTMQAAADHLQKCGVASGRIGFEPGFMPKDGFDAIADALPQARFADASMVLTRLRMIKTKPELDLLREATARISASMQATIQAAGEGTSKFAIIERLRQEETRRELAFEYCLLTLGNSHNRAGSSQTWKRGEVMSIDSGGNLHGYIGDICRMGVLGEPDAELSDLLAEVEAVQQAAFGEIAPGKTGAEMIAAGEAELRRGPNSAHNDFFAHGMGLISHEAPFLMTNHPVAYEGIDAGTPFQPGMVLSVETTMQHPTRGYIKLEDTVILTKDGHEVFGAADRGWIVRDVG